MSPVEYFEILLLFATFVVGLVGLCYTIFSDKAKK